MWNLDDKSKYDPFANIEMGVAMTYGNNDRAKRETIRLAASEVFPVIPNGVHRWAFRIFVRKSGDRPFDLDNVPKLIVDAFCGGQIRSDSSKYSHVGLYPADTLDHVVVLQVAGERSAFTDSTRIEIFRLINATDAQTR